MNLCIRFCVGLALASTMTCSALAKSPPETKITVNSPAFQTGGAIPDQFTCKGADVNPPLVFHGVPAGTKGLALIVDDPDAPGGLFTHWLVWNIEPATAKIGEKNLPAGAVQGTNDFGKSRYGGPCPPSGTHRYFFRLIAVDVTLELKSGAKRQEVDKAIAGHVLGRGELMARFSR